MSSMAPFTNMAWISNYIHYEVWDEITYKSIPKPNGDTFDPGPWKFGNG